MNADPHCRFALLREDRWIMMQGNVAERDVADRTLEFGETDAVVVPNRIAILAPRLLDVVEDLADEIRSATDTRKSIGLTEALFEADQLLIEAGRRERGD